MSKYDALFEDEDDIFTGSPKSKFWDIANQASNEIVEEEFDKLFEKLAVMEMMLSSDKDYDYDINKEIANYAFNNSVEVDSAKKGLYMEITGEIVCRLDS